MSGKGGRLNFSFDLQPRSAGSVKSHRSGNQPFRVLLIADLSGRAQRNVENAADLGSRLCPRIDVDNCDSILMKYAPCIQWPIGKIVFQELEDFHPDQLYRKLEVFKSLRETRKKLNDPSTRDDVIQQFSSPKPVTPKVDEIPEEKSTEDNVLDQLLARPSKSDGTSQAQTALSSLIHQIVAPHIVPKADPKVSEYLASVEAAISDQMRGILHHRDFQELEATWMGISNLVSDVDLDDGFELCLLDATKKELLDDIYAHSTDLAASGLYRQWVDKATGTPDGQPWSMVIGCHAFENSEADMDLLTGLGIMAGLSQTPFIADAAPSLVGCSSFAKAQEPSKWAGEVPLWDEFRKGQFKWIGLACPRILMRTPYGPSYEQVDTFDFEELTDVPEHEHFLWGSAALACAKLVGTAFQEEGWDMSLDGPLDLEDLPSYTYSANGEKRLKPCAEVFLSDRAGDELSRRGFTVLLSYRHQNAVRVRNIQSITDPPTALAGPWG